MPELARPLLVRDFQIRNRRPAARAPVDDVLTAIDQAFVVEAHENFDNRSRICRVHGESVARPIAGRPHPLHLLSDRPAAFLLPLPATLDKFLVAHLAAALLTFAAPSGFGASALEIGESFAAELHFDDHLRGNRGVVHTG